MKRIKISNLDSIKNLFEGNDKVRNKALKHVLDGNIKTPWWLICITSGSGFPIFTTNQLQLVNCLGVLPIAFDDMIPNKKYWQDKEAWKKTFDFTYRLPCKNHARDIIKLLDRVSSEERLVVNCEAGISRSSAVAYFAAQYMGLVPEELFNRNSYNPNPLIGALLREEAGFISQKDSWKLLKDSPHKPNPWGDETK